MIRRLLEILNRQKIVYLTAGLVIALQTSAYGHEKDDPRFAEAYSSLRLIMGDSSNPEVHWRLSGTFQLKVGRLGRSKGKPSID